MHELEWSHDTEASRSEAQQGPEAFLESLREQAAEHRAVRHPYLQALAAGSLPNPAAAVRDFLHQYYGYSEWFQRYLTGLIHQLDDAEHRRALIHNLAQECGQLSEADLHALGGAGIDPDWVDNVPHPELYRRMLGAAGMDADWLSRHRVGEQVLIWRHIFLLTCSSNGAVAAVGALGLGTEGIVRQVYRPLRTAVRHLAISARDCVFIDLHSEVDDEHGDVLDGIALDFSHSAQNRRLLRQGMMTALFLREAFFDAMWRGALTRDGARS